MSKEQRVPVGETEEEKKKKKKFLIPIIIIAAVLLLGGTAGLLAGLGVFKGNTGDGEGDSTEESSEEIVVDENTQLWWNADRGQYAGQSAIGTSSREVDKDDGYYHVLFATEGRQVTRRIAEKKVLNIVDSNDLMGLVFDEKGIIIGMKKVEEFTGGYAIQGWYVNEIMEDRTLLMNTAQTLNGMDEEYRIPETARIYDVSGMVNFIGMEIKFEDLQQYDRIYAVKNLEDEIYAVFVTSRYIKPEVYWNIERQWDSELLCTTRTPDEEGFYSFLLACNGEQVTVKTKSRDIANTIDKQAAKCFGLNFDKDGYISKFVAASSATGGGTYGSWYHIMKLEGKNITAEKIIKATDTGTVMDGILADGYRAFDVSGTGDFIGQEIFDLKVTDQIHALKNANNEICIVFVVGRLSNTPVYWNVERQYDSTAKSTKRTPGADGLYHFTLAVGGVQKDFVTADKKIADTVDSYAARCFSLKTNGNVIESVMSPNVVKGGGACASWFDVLSINGNQFHSEKLIAATDTGSEYDGVIAPDCEIYNVSDNYVNYSGEKAKLQVGDRVHCLTNLKKEVAVIFIVNRPVQSDVYWNITRRYDTANKTTTRKPDANGYYVFDLAVGGKQVTLRTKDKKVADSVDSFAARCFGLKVSGDIILKAYGTSAIPAGTGGTCASWYDVLSVNGRSFHAEKLIAATDTGSKVDATMSADCRVVNVGGLYTVCGEYTTLQVGDRVHCLKNKAGEVDYVIIVNRVGKDKTGYCTECGKSVVWKAASGNISLQQDEAGNNLAISHVYVPTNMSLTTQATAPNRTETNGTSTSYYNTAAVHVDLCGKTLTSAVDQRMFATFGSGAQMTFFDSVGGGKLVTTNGRPDDRGAAFWMMSGNSKMVFKGLTIDISKVDQSTTTGAFYTANTTSGFEFNDCTIIGGHVKNGALFYTNGTVTLNNTTVTGGTADEGGVIYIYDTGKLIVNGNTTVKGGKPATVYLAGKAKIDTTEGLTCEDGSIYVTTAAEGAFTTANFKGLASKFASDVPGATILEKEGVLYLTYVIDGVEFESTTASVAVGSTAELTARTTPAASDSAKIIYTSSDPTKVTVSEDGTVIGIAETRTPVKITATVEYEGVTFTAECEVTVTPATASLDHYHAETTSDEMASDSAKIAYTAWTDATTLPNASGYYFLDTDVTLSTQFSMGANVDLHLCLNGHTIKMADGVNVDRTIAIFNAGGKLSVCDCSDGETGCIAAPTSAFSAQGRAVWLRFGTFNFYGGTIVGSESNYIGGGSVAVSADTTMNMYGGTVKNGSAITPSSTTIRGGNIYVDGTFNMYGGTVKDGFTKDTSTATGAYSNGGNVANTPNGIINIYGGELVGGKSTGYGGNIYNVGTLLMEGGTLSGGYAGHTYNPADGSVTAVTGVTANWRVGGNLYNSGTADITGGTFENGTAYFAGNIANNKYLSIDGKDEKVVIKNGKTYSSGGNIWCDTSSTLLINNAEISGGNAGTNTANIFSQGPVFTLTNSTVSGGTTATYGNVNAAGGTVTIENVTVEEIEQPNPTTLHASGIFVSASKSAVNFTIKDSTVPELRVASADSVTLAGKNLIGSEAGKGIFIDSTAMGGKTKVDTASFDTASKIYVDCAQVGTVVANGADYIASFAPATGTDWELVAEDGAIKAVKSNLHKHCICGTNDCEVTGHTCDTTIVWNEWTSTTTLPTLANTEAGDNYFCLTNDVTISSVWFPAAKADGTRATDMAGTSINICLNGHKITVKAARLLSSLYAASPSVTHTANIRVSFTDCQGTGTVTTVVKDNDNDGGIFWLVGADGSLNIYGGNYTATEGASCKKSGGLFSIGNTSVLNLFGGTIADGTVVTGTGTAYRYGGNIYLGGSAVLNMYGGTIKGGKETMGSVWGAGGNVYIAGTATMNMYDGTVEGGHADSNGGNIALYSVFNMHGGTVKGGTANSDGANIWGDNGAVINISGGTVEGGVSPKNGGNIYIKGSATRTGVLNITSGTIKDGTAGNGSTAWNAGGNIYATAYTNAIIKDATISGGIAPTGGNICYGSSSTHTGTLTIENATITGGKAIKNSGGGGEGGNIFLDTNATAVIKGSTIKNGVATMHGGNIFTKSTSCTLDGTNEISGGTLESGEASNVHPSAPITLGASFATRTGAPIGISMTTAGTFTATAGNADDFVSDDTQFSVVKLPDNGKIALKSNESKVRFEKNEIIVPLTPAQELQFTTTLDSAEITSVTWASKDETVAKVTADETDKTKALVTAVGAGETTVTVTVNGTENASIKVTVKEHSHCFLAGTVEDGEFLYEDEEDPSKCIKHTCELADWTAWTSTTKLPGYDDLQVGENYFYLTKDVTISATWLPAANASGTKMDDMGGRNINICLNGHTITSKTSRFLSTLYATSPSVTHTKNLVVRFTDCADTPGTIKNYSGNTGTNQGSFAWLNGENGILELANITLDGSATTGGCSGLIISANSTSQVIIYSGTYKNGVNTGAGGFMASGADSKITIYGGTFDFIPSKGYGAGFYITGNSVLNFYGGTIQNAVIDYGTATWRIGGSMYLESKSTVNMYGGEIIGGVATHGGNIGVETGTFNMYGGVIKNGQSTYAAKGGNGTITTVGGGNVFVNKGVFNLYGGEITGGTALRSGGNVGVSYTAASGTTEEKWGEFHMYGGKVTNGTVNSNKNGISVGGNVSSRGKFTLEGGEISGGRAPENVQASANTVNAGITAQGTGGNIAVIGGIFKMTGGEVKSGSAAVGGGNLYVQGYWSQSPITVEITGGTMTKGNGWAGAGLRLNSYDSIPVSVTIGGTAEITDNHVTSTTGYASGIYVGAAAVKLTLTGKAKVCGNTNTSTAAVASDIQLTASARLTVKDYEGTGPIYIRIGTSADNATTSHQTGEFGTVDKDYSAVLKASDSTLAVVISGTAASLATGR